MAKLKTLFLNPPYVSGVRLDIQRYTIRARAASLFPPIWLSWAAASVPDSRVVDAIASKLTTSQVVPIAKKYDLVVIQADTATINQCIRLADVMKSTTNAEICLVGPHVSVLADEIMKGSKCIDYIARREYDYTVKELASDKVLKDIPGLSYRDNGKICHNPNRPFIENLDQLPFVNPIYKRDLPIKAYGIHELHHPMTTLFTGRGCPYGCKYFCRWPAVFNGNRYRTRSPHNVYDEVLWVKENMPEVKEILFDEGTFTTFPERVEEICDLIKPLDVIWSCNARADVPLRTLKKMKEAGCRLVIVGFENASQRVLNTIHKGTIIDRMEKFVEDCKNVGILIHGCFMVGLPGETRQTMEDTFRWAVKMDVDSIQFSVATPYPGTEFWKYLKDGGYLRSDVYVDERGFQEAVYDYPGLSSKEICEASESFHRRFIFRPRFVWKTFRLVLSDKYEAKRVARGFYAYMRYLWKRSNA